MRLKITVAMYEEEASTLDSTGRPVEPEPLKMVGFMAHVSDDDIRALSVAAQKPPDFIADILVMRVKEAAQGVTTGFFKSKKLAALTARATDTVKTIARLSAVHRTSKADDASLDSLAEKAEEDLKAFRAALAEDDAATAFEGISFEDDTPGVDLIAP